MKDGFLELLGRALDKIDSPYLIAGLVLGCFFITNLSDIISSVMEAIRKGHANKAEVEGRRKILDTILKSIEDKRNRGK